MIKEWIDKQKAKRKLLKFYRMCNKKRKYILYKAWDIEQYNKIEWLQYAIAYILYKDFHCGNFDVVWDYDNHVSDKEMEELIRQLCNSFNEDSHDNNEDRIIYTNNLSNLESWDIGQKALNTLSQVKGTIICDVSSQTMYVSDGKNFIEMC